MNYCFIILLHLLFYLFTTYTFFTFVLLNIFLNCVNNLQKYAKQNNITESKNPFLKPIIYMNNMKESNTMYYADITLSKYSWYNTIKENCKTISEYALEILSINTTMLSAQIIGGGMSMISSGSPSKGPSMGMMSLLPMMMGSMKPRQPQQIIHQPEALNTKVVSDLITEIKKETKPEENALLYDSDDDTNIIDDISIE